MAVARYFRERLHINVPGPGMAMGRKATAMGRRPLANLDTVRSDLVDKWPADTPSVTVLVMPHPSDRFGHTND